MTKFLGEHVYSRAEKRQHLAEFVASIESVLDDSTLHLHFPNAVEHHRNCLRRARTLLDSKFDQTDLSELSREFSPVLWLHKEWCEPLEQSDDGRWRSPNWYSAFEQIYERLVRAADRLRVVGEVKYSS